MAHWLGDATTYGAAVDASPGSLWAGQPWDDGMSGGRAGRQLLGQRVAGVGVGVFLFFFFL